MNRILSCLSFSVLNLALASIACAQPPSAPVDFSRDVIPILTKAGCNTGACHGAAAGRGYLTLSLFGSRPDDDYECIVHAHASRYIDVQEPLSSLLLQKPGGFLEHGGDVRLDADESDFEVVRRWIAQQAPVGSLSKLTHITIRPTELLELKVGESAQLSVAATWSDGDSKPVTPWVVVEGASPSANDPAAPIIYGYPAPDEIQFTAQKPGYWPVTLRVGSIAHSIQIWVRGTDQATQASPPTVAQAETIDGCIARSNGRAGLLLAEPTAPHHLARRLWIDLTGRHPGIEQWQTATEQIEQGNLPQVVDGLLASKSFQQRASKQIAGWTGGASKGGAPLEARLANDIAGFLESDDSLLHLVQAMLSVGESQSECATSFHQFASEPRSRGELVASAFLGVRIGCAQCHDHPLDHWTQDDYFSMAACWAEIDTQGTLRRTPGRTTTDLRTGDAATPRLPGQSNAYQGDLPADMALTHWICNSDNELLTANLSNRIWFWLMGDGLVVDVDDHRATNPPIDADLLRLLSHDLVEHDFSLKALVRSIVLSDAYQRKADDTASRLAHRLVSARGTKPIDVPFAELAGGALGILRSEATAGAAADSMMMMVESDNGCSRYQNCSDPVRESLDLIAGQEINQVVKDAISASWPEGSPDLQGLNRTLERLYLQVFGQQPPQTSKQAWNELLTQAASDRHREVVEDLLWSWLVHSDFVQLH